MEVIRPIPVTVTSDTSAAVNSKPIYVGGSIFDVQITEPAAVTLTSVQVSSDKATWVNASDIDGTALGNVGAGYYPGIRESAAWARIQIATDSSGPRSFSSIISVHKESR